MLHPVSVSLMPDNFFSLFHLFQSFNPLLPHEERFTAPLVPVTLMPDNDFLALTHLF